MKKEHTLVKKFAHLVVYQIKNSFKKLLAFYVSINSPNKHLHRHIVVFHQRPPWSQYNYKKKIVNLQAGAESIFVYHYIFHQAVKSPRRSLLTPHHMSSCSVGANTDAAGSKGHSRLFRPAVSVALRVALARRGGRCATQPHCNACRRNSQGPSPPQQRNVQSATTPPPYRPFSFSFIHVVFPFAPSPTQKNNSALSQRKEKRRHDPTVPPRANALLCPPPSPHRRPQSHRRVNTTMCTTPSCSEQWPGHGQASPRSIFPPLRSCVP
ncbi:hypothetical protein TCSYLVIO_006701, partial [Trypanosoma cruzi]